jgi:hypothetical protein
MPRLVPTDELLRRRATMPLDHPRNVASAWRCGKRQRAFGRMPDPWLWNDHPATLAAFEAGYNREPRPSAS